MDHDIFEGLPVRNWRRDIVTVAPPPAHDGFPQVKDKWDIELPWGMPKDAPLMPQHSQDLLRAARSGRIYQKRPVMEEEDLETDLSLADKPEKKDLDPKEEGFSVKTWKLVPKHLEGPEIEYLAKRRKGLRGAPIKDGPPQGPMMTKMTVRKIDPQGNTYVEDVVVPEGQAVEGEVIAQTVVTDPAVAGVGADGPAQVQPIKRRPPPPKRKAKGPGRGRRKKLPLPRASAPAEPGAAPVDGQIQEAPTQEAAVGADGVKVESTTTPTNGNEDTEIGDGSIVPSDEEGDDGEEGSDDDDQEGEGEGEGSQADDNEQDNDRDRMILDNLPSEPKIAPPKPAITDFPPESPSNSFNSRRLSHGPPTSGSPLKRTFTPPSYSPTISTGHSEGVHHGEDEEEGDADEHQQHQHDEGHQFEQHQQHDDHFGEDQQSFHDTHEHQYEPQHHPEILPHTADNVHEAHAAQEGYEVSTTDFQGMLSDTPPGFQHDEEHMLLDAGEQHGHDELPDMADFDPKLTVEETAGEGGEHGEQEADDEKFEDLLGSLEEHLNEGVAAQGVVEEQEAEGEKGTEGDGAVAAVAEVLGPVIALEMGEGAVVGEGGEAGEGVGEVKEVEEKKEEVEEKKEEVEEKKEEVEEKRQEVEEQKEEVEEQKEEDAAAAA